MKSLPSAGHMVSAASIVAASTIAACGGGGAAVAPDDPTDAPRPEVVVSFRFVSPENEAEPTPDQPPHTPVQLVVIETGRGRTVHPIEEAIGVCHLAPRRGPALVRAQCGWLSDDVAFYVTREHDRLLVFRADASGAPAREVLRVDLPPRAVLGVIDTSSASR